MVCLGQNGHFSDNVCKYAAVWLYSAPAHLSRDLRPPASQYAAVLHHFKVYVDRFAPLRMHGLNLTFAWCASVKTAISQAMSTNTQQYGYILHLPTSLATSGPQHRNVQQFCIILRSMLTDLHPCGCMA